MRLLCFLAAMLVGAGSLGAAREVLDSAPRKSDIVFTLRSSDGISRLILLRPDGSERVLSAGFHAAADPEISWDGQRLLFAAQKRPSDRWQIYEMPVAGGVARQVVTLPFDCRSPIYQSTAYNIASDRPWRQIAFVAQGALHSARLDGSDVRRLTWHDAADSDPQMLPDGRMIFSSRGGLFGVNADGTDFAEFSAHEGAAEKRTPAVTAGGLVVFIEGETIGSVSLRRNLHSYRRLTRPEEGAFLSPSALPDGTILVSRKRGPGRYSLWRFDPANGSMGQVLDNPGGDIVQAKLVASRPEPDGRSSVVDESNPTGKFYSLSVPISDSEDGDWQKLAKRLRVLAMDGRSLGEMDLEPDGSFQIEVPANTPLRLQVLDASGAPLRTCNPVWVRNNENRGCIGCHEDGELAPENHLAEALKKPAVQMGAHP